MKWSFRIGSIFGVPLMVHITFLLLLVLVYFSGVSILGTGGLNGVVFVVLIFASVVFHEMSHALVARYCGIEVIDITLLPIGGVARMAAPPRQPIQEVLIAAAGPLSSLFLGFLLWFFASIYETDVTLTDMSVGGSILAQLTAVNFMLALFNLLPAFPMDGGRILRGLLGIYLSPHTATRIAVGVGQALAIVMFFVGLLIGQYFLLLIALFVYIGAETEERQMGIMVSLGGTQVQQAMITNVATIAPSRTIGETVELSFRSFQGDFPVMDERRLVGLVTRDNLVAGLHQYGPSIAVSQVMIKDFPTTTEDTTLIDVLQKIQDTGTRAIPVMKAGELIGLITLEQLGRYNMVCSGYSCEFLSSAKE